MKLSINAFACCLIAMMLFSCKSMQETTATEKEPPPVQLQYQEREERLEKQQERTGLTYEEVQTINNYGQRKAELYCKMVELEKQSSQALSDVASRDNKEAIVALDTQFSELNREIDTNCNTDAKQKFLRQIVKQYTVNCK